MEFREKRGAGARSIAIGLLAIAVTLLCGINLQAQSTSVLSTGLNSPTKIITAGQASLIVTEAGLVSTPNSGRISLVNRTTGVRRTLIDGLPSGPNRSGGGPPESSGPSGVKLSGTKLYVTIGAGDTLIPVTGGFIANPSPSSPLLSSVLELTLPADFESLVSPFSLSPANQTTLAANGLVTLTNAEGSQLTARLVANLPNTTPDPRLTLPTNTRESNPFGVEISGDFLYVVDASFNLLYRLNILSGAFDTFAAFPVRPNPTPVGPPVIEAVPDSVRLSGDNLFVSFLTGFPFVQGLAEVRMINLATQAQTVVISNLTSALDVLPITGGNTYFVLEYSGNMLAQAPGRLKYVFNPAQPPTVLVDNLITPTSMARDGLAGTIYITEISTGRIIRVPLTPTATGVEISGRVLTADGRGVRNAVVSITSPSGTRLTATTSSLGYYRFENVPAGNTYVIGAAAKRFRFASGLIDVSDNVAGVDLIEIQ